MITTWRGQPLDDLSRDELIEAVVLLGRERDQAREAHQRTLNLWKAIRGRQSARVADAEAARRAPWSPPDLSEAFTVRDVI